MFNLVSTRTLKATSSWFPDFKSPACAGVWSYSSQSEGLCISPFWTLWRSCQSILPAPLHGTTMTLCINHSSWWVLPSNLLSVLSVPWSRSLLKLLNLLFSIHFWFWEMSRSRSACQCPCMNDASLTVSQNSLSHLDCGQTISDGLETASSMNSPGEQLGGETKAWGLRAGRDLDGSTWAAGGPPKSRIQSG